MKNVKSKPKKISYYGALLHKPWEKGAHENHIMGAWAEDDSTYNITAPYQLRDLLIELQNDLSKEYMKIAARSFKRRLTGK